MAEDRVVALYGMPIYDILSLDGFWSTTGLVRMRRPCTQCDSVEITEQGDEWRSFRCVNCGQVTSTNERASTTGPTTRLVTRCGGCGEEVIPNSAFCIFCGGRL